jgi:hypothetical protein
MAKQVTSRYVVAVAQLGERQTEDLKDTSSILVRDNLFAFPWLVLVVVSLCWLSLARELGAERIWAGRTVEVALRPDRCDAFDLALRPLTSFYTQKMQYMGHPPSGRLEV